MYKYVDYLPNSCMGGGVAMEMGITYNIVNDTNVAVSMEIEQKFQPFYTGIAGCQHNWTMLLQRYNNDTWDWYTIGSRTGYVAENSPSHRTFTNIRKDVDQPLRLVVIMEYYVDSWGKTHKEIIYTNTFYNK